MYCHIATADINFLNNKGTALFGVWKTKQDYQHNNLPLTWVARTIEANTELNLVKQYLTEMSQGDLPDVDCPANYVKGSITILGNQEVMIPTPKTPTQVYVSCDEKVWHCGGSEEISFLIKIVESGFVISTQLQGSVEIQFIVMM